ncbi:MAG: sugar ABC transporter substrate-binding protein [candidate division NC10 bacterium]|nr:sugar ABC transporter substrate-binding protein [candidate division NC10 bacterium]
MPSHKQSEQCPKGVTRREVLRLGAGMAAGAAIGPFVLRTAGAADAFTWQRFKGTKLFVLVSKNTWAETMEKMVPDFEKLTGIQVEVSVLPEIQARQKATVEFTAGNSGIDAWYTSLPVEKRRFWKSGWYTDLNKFLKDPTMTAPDYAWDDIAAGVRKSVTQSDGTLSALPVLVDPFILIYRKDLYAQKGLKPPKTMGEWEEQAQKLHNPPGMYGFVARGLKNANATSFAYVIYALGGEYLTRDGKSALDSPVWVKAVEWYAGMLKRFAPPGVVNFNWYECSSAFQQGQVASYVDAASFAGPFEDKEKSKVAGQVGYAVLPAGPAGQVPPFFTNALAVSPQSKNQGAGYFFIQWASSRQSAIKELLAGVPSVRAAAWNAPEVKAKAKMPADWDAAYLESLRIGREGLPEIVDVTQYRDIIGVAIQKAIEGGNSAQLVAQAHKEFQEVLDKTEK